METPSSYLVPVYFIAWWCFIVYLISVLGGWRRLSETYRLAGSFHGKIWRFRTVSLRWRTRYGGCVNIGANPLGLYLSVLFIFRPGHPALFIPWSDVSVREVRLWGARRLEMRFRTSEAVPVRIRPALGRLLAEAAGENWPLERGH